MDRTVATVAGATRRIRVWRALAVLALFTVSAHAGVGDLDNGFGANGIVNRQVVTRTGAVQNTLRMGLLGDGGLFYDPTDFSNPPRPFGLLRIGADGRGPETPILWPDGAAPAAWDSNTLVQVRRDDGSTLLPIRASGRISMLRLLGNGVADTTFGRNGLLGLDALVPDPGGDTPYIEGMAPDADGNSLVAFTRYSAYGFKDTTIRSIDVAGNVAPDFSIHVTNPGTSYGDDDETLLALTALYGGEVRADFGIHGVQFYDSAGRSIGVSASRWPFDGAACANTLGLGIVGRLAGGDLILVGMPAFGARSGYMLVRVRPNGTLDPTFGANGYSCVEVPGSIATSDAAAATWPMLARLSDDGRFTYLVQPAPFSERGARLVRVFNAGPSAGRPDPAFHGGFVDLPWLYDRRQVGDVHAATDGSVTISSRYGGDFGVLRLLGTNAPSTGALWIKPDPATSPVPEATGVVHVTVMRGLGNNGAVSVDYATSEGTARAGSDYTPVSGTLRWADGDTSDRTIDIPLVKDDVRESGEVFTFALANVTGGSPTIVGKINITITADPFTVNLAPSASSTAAIGGGGGGGGGGAMGSATLALLTTVQLLATTLVRRQRRFHRRPAFLQRLFGRPSASFMH